MLKCSWGEPEKRAEFSSLAVIGSTVLIRIDKETAWVTREEIAALAVLFPVMKKGPGEIR